MRLAGAPISWGVCEVPGWGLQLPPDRVLAEMRALGLAATEAGPPGFLPADPLSARRILRTYGLGLVGGFVTAVLHDPSRRATELGRRVRDRSLDYAPAVRRGLYSELGTGSARIADVLALLGERGYDGWYVLEQDVMLDEAPAAAPAGVERSLAFARASGRP